MTNRTKLKRERRNERALHRQQQHKEEEEEDYQHNGGNNEDSVKFLSLLGEEEDQSDDESDERKHAPMKRKTAFLFKDLPSVTFLKVSSTQVDDNHSNKGLDTLKAHLKLLYV